MSHYPDTLKLSGARFEASDPNHAAIDVQLPATAACLLGDWLALLGYLQGQHKLTAGRVTLGQADGRAAVLDGTLGAPPAEGALCGVKNVSDALISALLLHGTKEAAARRRTRELLASCGAEAAASQPWNRTSAAEKYRLGIAFALLTEPRWAILPGPEGSVATDEATQAALVKMTEHCTVTLLCRDLRYAPPTPFCAHAVLLEEGATTVESAAPCYHVAIQGDVRRFTEAASKQGIELRRLRQNTLAVGPALDPEVDLLVKVPSEIGTRALFAVAHSTDASVLHLSALQPQSYVKIVN